MRGELVVLPDAAAVAKHVADWLTDLVGKATGPVRIGLSGGSTPKALFTLLGSDDYAERIAWERVHLFWGDERFVPYDSPDSNYGMTRATLLSKIDMPAGNIHPMPTDGDPDDAARRYERLLKAEYGADSFDPQHFLFDVNFLGLGEDGHTASLIPGQPVLNERTRWVAQVTEGRPEARLTLTYPALESAAVTAFLAVGAGKRQILLDARAPGADFPASRLQPHGKLLWIVDRAAAGE